MFYDDLMKMSMNNWLVVLLGIKVDCDGPRDEEERYYQRH